MVATNFLQFIGDSDSSDRDTKITNDIQSLPTPFDEVATHGIYHNIMIGIPIHSNVFFF